MTIQRSSLALGVVLGVLSVLSLGAFQQADYQLQSPPHPFAALFGGPIQVEGIPAPDDLASVSGDVTIPPAGGTHVILSVPPNQRFVVTRMQASQLGTGTVSLLQDLGGTITEAVPADFVNGTMELGSTTGLVFEPGANVVYLNTHPNQAPAMRYVFTGYFAEV